MDSSDIERLKELVISARRNRYLREYRREFDELESKEYPREKYRTDGDHKRALTYRHNRMECLRVMIEALVNGEPKDDGSLHYYSPHCGGNTISLLPDEWREVITTLMQEGELLDEDLPDVLH